MPPIPTLPALPPDLLQRVSALSTPVIVGAAIIHFLMFLWLGRWARRDLRRLAHDFDSFTRDLRHRSLFDRSADLSDQIDAFLADIRDVLDDPSKTGERRALLQRLQILDERRRYLQSHAFETTYNVCRTMIEAYPLMGVLGTILAIGAALQLPADDNSSSAVNAIVRYFGNSIWSTFAGLFSAIVLMFWNSLVEPRFQRLSENRLHIRETVARVKRELSAATGDPKG